jgi:HD-like signal output (HDOD) protein
VNQDLSKRVLASPQLPTLPVIAMKVLELTRRENVSVPEIANVIMTDPALASKILKTVNSPFYGLTKQVATVSGALVILGLQAAKTLALGFSLLSNLRVRDKGELGFDHATFWKRCTYSAVASRVIARKMSVIQQEEAFLAGLMSNVGELVMHRVMPEEFDALFAQSKGDQTRLYELCREKFGADPGEVSAMLAEKWQLPPMLSAPIALRDKREQADPAIRPLVEAVSAGLYAAGVFIAEDSAKAIADARQELTVRLNLPAEDIEAILSEIGASAKDAALMLDLHIGSNRSYQEILDEAQEALVCLSLQSQKQVQVIQKEVETLQVKATTDPLTGLANRLRFDEFFHQQFHRVHAAAAAGADHHRYRSFQRCERHLRPPGRRRSAAACGAAAAVIRAEHRPGGTLWRRGICPAVDGDGHGDCGATRGGDPCETGGRSH